MKNLIVGCFPILAATLITACTVDSPATFNSGSLKTNELYSEYYKAYSALIDSKPRVVDTLIMGQSTRGERLTLKNLILELPFYPKDKLSELAQYFDNNGLEDYNQADHQSSKLGFAEVFGILGSYQAYDRLLKFAIDYIAEPVADGELASKLPNDLKPRQVMVYVGLAAYVDVIARPFWIKLKSSQQTFSTRANRVFCEYYAMELLSIAG